MGWRRGWVVPGLAVALALAPRASGGPPAGIRWAPSLEAGLAEAKAKGLPLMVALNMDNDPGNDAMVKAVYTDPAVTAAAAKCVCTVASLDGHPEAKDPVTGRAVCSRFGSVTCAEHRAVEKVVRIQWLKKGSRDVLNSPQHFFLAPDGRRLFQRTWQVEAKELASLMARAGALSAPATLSAWDTQEGRLARAADALRPVREEALRALAAMKDPAVDGKLSEMAKAAANEDMRCDVLDAFAAAMTPDRIAFATALLGAKAPATRMHAAVALEASKDSEALKALGAALGREKEAQVRGVLFRCLAGGWPGDAGARGLVLAGLREKSPEVLPSVLVALAPWAEDPQVFAAAKALAFGKDPHAVRAAACWILGLSKHREAAADLRGIKDDGRGMRLRSIADLAARMLLEGVDPDEYRRARKWFTWSPVRHPGEPEE